MLALPNKNLGRDSEASVAAMGLPMGMHPELDASSV
jgi:hypothetical protein